ncbi:hypothetical protein A2U01_0036741 [Trifolium medium]|uniref:Uncharacterized protein n=1 Tax=Trifolium medium TaxID=97028 RepID=A0A392PU36_9FABA|nr:hypothetical protein [Trifolium medium]
MPSAPAFVPTQITLTRNYGKTEVEFFQESGDFSKKRIEVNFFLFGGGDSDMEGCEVREPLEEARKERNGLIGDCDGELETAGDREKLFGDGGELFQVAVVERFEDALP